MGSTLAATALVIVLVGCTTSEASPVPPWATATPQVSTPPSTASSLAPRPHESESSTASPSQSASATADLVVDSLAEVRVDDLTLRVESTTGADRIGLLPLGEPAYIVTGPVEAEGYLWYQLASVRQPYVGGCGDPAPEPLLACAEWFGWAVGGTPGGDAWLGATEARCPTARDRVAYLALLPSERLACAGSDEWRLTAYVAPETEGRGCYPVWVVDPFWLDPSCNFLFLQPEESQFDSFQRLQVFVHPDLGSCTLASDTSGCPFEALKGSWVEVSGHLDHPAAQDCIPVLSSNFEEAPYPPPSTDEVVFRCRTRFVVTGVQPTESPGG